VLIALSEDITEPGEEVCGLKSREMLRQACNSAVKSEHFNVRSTLRELMSLFDVKKDPLSPKHATMSRQKQKY
jgi:hypothetical protein